MLHLQALEENRKWEAERARQAVVEAGTLDVDEAVEDDLGGERKDGEVDGSVVEGVDSEALEDVLTMEEREMQELVAAHEQHDTRFDPFHTRTEEEFERPCEGWMRYHACQHGSGHCGYLEAQRQGQAGHDRRPEGELPQMDERMDEGFDGAQSGVQDAGSIWGSDDTDSSFEDELWRLGDQITDTGAGGGDEMDMS